jgi:hypothetical protein
LIRRSSSLWGTENAASIAFGIFTLLPVNGCEKPTLNGGVDQRCGMVTLC